MGNFGGEGGKGGGRMGACMKPPEPSKSEKIGTGLRLLTPNHMGILLVRNHRYLHFVPPALPQPLRARFPSLHLLRRETPQVPSRHGVSAFRKPLFPTEPEFLVLLVAFVRPSLSWGMAVSRRSGWFVGFGSFVQSNVEEVFFVGGADGVGIFAL